MYAINKTFDDIDHTLDYISFFLMAILSLIFSLGFSIKYIRTKNTQVIVAETNTYLWKAHP